MVPINPESINGEKTTQIIHERCVIENDGTVGLRFPVKNGSSNKDNIDLYSNGVKVNRDLWAPSLEFKTHLVHLKSKSLCKNIFNSFLSYRSFYS